MVYLFFKEKFRKPEETPNESGSHSSEEEYNRKITIDDDKSELIKNKKIESNSDKESDKNE